MAKETTKIVMQSMIALASAALGLVAALAWNDAIKETIKIILSGDESLASKYTYAIFATILAVVALPNGRPSGTNLIDFSFATKRSSLRD